MLSDCGSFLLVYQLCLLIWLSWGQIWQIIAVDVDGIE
jgi:hypothetical protein